MNRGQYAPAPKPEPPPRACHKVHSEGLALAREAGDAATRERAHALLTRSVHVFPDSPVALDAHLTRSRLLATLGRTAEAETEALRAREHYVAIE